MNILGSSQNYKVGIKKVVWKKQESISQEVILQKNVWERMPQQEEMDGQMIVLGSNQNYKVGIKKVVWKKQGNILQELNLQKNVWERIKLH